MTVSIIVPVYNAEKYLNQCLDSIIRQTLKDKEIVCVNDGSTDRSGEILRDYEKRYPFIKILTQENQGSGKARNRGLSIASGTYIAFCDADDFYYDIGALEKMAAACETHQMPICGSFMKILENGEILDKPTYRELAVVKEDGMAITFRDYQDDFYYQSFLFRRSLLEKYHILFPDYLRYQDPPFLVKALTLVKRFWIMPVELYCYRYGHQDFACHATKIKDVLMGIRDNLRVAIEDGYDKLYDKLLDERLNGVYYEDIMRNMCDDVMEQLLQINRLNKSYPKAKEIRALKESYSYYDLCKSYEMLASFARIRQSNYGFVDYFQEKGICRVAVYGIGYYGKMLVYELEQANIEIAALIDKKGMEYGSRKVIKPEDATPECDCIIVTPLYPDEIVRMLEEKGMKTIMTLSELLKNMLNLENTYKSRDDGNISIAAY